MNAYEFYKCPSWVIPNAVVINHESRRQAVVARIDWNGKIPEVYYTIDGSADESRCLLTEFIGRYRPTFGSDGEQVRSGLTAGSVRSTPLLNAYAWSNRAINIIKREQWESLTVGEYLQEVSMEKLKNTRGVGKTVVAEFVDKMGSAGLKMRRYQEDEE